jgi:adenylosuccinate lyase
LTALINKGMSREDAYKLVQRNAAKAIDEGSAHFQHFVETDSEVTSLLSQDEIDQCFSLEHHLRNVDKIFERLGLND